MNRFLMTAAALMIMVSPVMAEDTAAPAIAAPAATVSTTTETTTITPTTEAVAPADDKVASDCKTEVSAKMTLPENASAEEQAQFDAAVAECVAAKATPTATTTDAEAAGDMAAPAAADAAPAADHAGH